MSCASAASAAEQALLALRSGQEEQAVEPLEKALQHWPDDPLLWQMLGLLHRAAHELTLAVSAFTKAAALAPDDGKIAHGLAQCRFEAGLPSLDAFDRCRALRADDLAVAQGWIAAIAAERGILPAINALAPQLAARPGWVDGHWLMSRLRHAAGQQARTCESLQEGVLAEPRNPALWHQWIRTLLKQKSFSEALAVIREARRHVGDHTLDMFEAAALSESGQLQAATAAWGRLGALSDVEAMIFEARHLLRIGRADIISARAERVPGPQNLEPLFPYFDLAWRLTGNARAKWLDQPGLVQVHDIADRLPPLDRLAALLRTLHPDADQPLEQSVRRGTQTDGPLLSRIEPEIVSLRHALMRTVRDHLDRLPPADPMHPQLRFPRDRPIRFSGSWSVRLQDSGHHEQHVHPQGWFSSALYVSLPEQIGGAAKEGWLTLGQPQDSLALDLPPVAWVEPKPGRLVLFPSTMWHGTVPFRKGERLTVAFDVARPV